MTAHLDIATGSRAHLTSERGADLYETPAVAVQALLAVETIAKTVWEPACGPGAIVRELRASGRTVLAQDLIDYGCPDSIAPRDFFLESQPPKGCVDLVTNPPFMHAERFAEHAISLMPHVYLLMRVGFLEGLRWERGLGKHLARVHVFAPRLPMMHRDGWQGPITNSSAIAFAWYVFARDCNAFGKKPSVSWVNWRKLNAETTHVER